MRYSVVIILLLLVCMNTSIAQQVTYTGREFKPLHGLSGLWKMDTQRGTIYEEWRIKEEGKLSGRSYKVKNNDTLVLENVLLSLQGNDIFYTPVVHDQNNQQPVPFKLISCTNNRYVFENAGHDYPQRVIYELVSANELRARIEGITKGKEKSSEFNYTRVK